MLVPGLQLIEDFISAEEELELIQNIDLFPEKWLNDLKRRVQHYGFKYNYTSKSLSMEDKLGPMPEWLTKISQKLTESRFINNPEQVVINEYKAGQGIGMHVDRVDMFGPIVASLSLLAPCEMRFVKRSPSAEEEKLTLPQRSLLVLAGEARYDWAHGISSVKCDQRISITFRTLGKDLKAKL